MLCLGREKHEEVVVSVPPERAMVEALEAVVNGQSNAIDLAKAALMEAQPRMIFVTPLQFHSRKRVKLGFTASPEVTIDRKEVWLDKQRRLRDGDSHDT